MPSRTRTVVYWVTTGLCAFFLLTALSYLAAPEPVVSGFNRVGYPQQLRIVLGLAKPAAAIVILLPGLAILKEWAYAGASYALVMAFIAHTAAGDGPREWALPPIILALLWVSYLTRPASRRAVTGGVRELRPR